MGTESRILRYVCCQIKRYSNLCIHADRFGIEILLDEAGVDVERKPDENWMNVTVEVDDEIM